MAVSMKNLDPAFQGVGQKAGTDIWRIENFRPVPIPKSDYGQFYCGDSYIVLQTTATKSGAYDLDKKTKSLLEEYFSARDTEEAKLCVQELNWPDYYPEFVRDAIIFAMERSEHHVELVGQLLEFLYSENTLSDKDIGAGLMFIAEEFDDTAIDMPLAPRFLGELVGRLSLIGATNFRALRDITVKVEDKANRMTIFDSALHIIKSSSAAGSLDAQTDDLIECERLLSEETL